MKWTVLLVQGGDEPCYAYRFVTAERVHRAIQLACDSYCNDNGITDSSVIETVSALWVLSGWVIPEEI